MKKIFMGAAAAFGVIPGLATVAKGLAAPPHAKLLFGGFVEAIGAAILIMLWINRNELQKLAQGKLICLVVLMFIGSFAAFVCYLAMYDWCIVTDPQFGTVIYPLWATGDLATVIRRAGGRWAALDLYGTYAIVTSVERSSSVVWALTLGSVFLLYQGIFSFATIAFGLLAAREESQSITGRKSKRRRGTSRRVSTGRRGVTGAELV